MLRVILLLLAAGFLVNAAAPPPVELLWPSGAPGAVGEEPADKPNLTIYLPDAARAAGVGVIVCPGGGYGGLAFEKEGTLIAQWWNSLGVAAFVLRYRVAPRYHHPAPLDDAQRAIRMVRAAAARYGVSADRIGIMGFSAGGHLASTAATHFDNGKESGDAVDHAGSRPDFAVLVYPVITLTEEPYVHKGSRQNLLGPNPDPKLVESLSSERQVTARTPPVFLFHTSADTAVPAENSVLFYLAARKAGVPAEMHIYEPGPHGVGLAATDFVLSSWPARLADWMRVRGLLR